MAANDAGFDARGLFNPAAGIAAQCGLRIAIP
jgi:hypothetical protein